VVHFLKNVAWIWASRTDIFWLLPAEILLYVSWFLHHQNPFTHSRRYKSCDTIKQAEIYNPGLLPSLSYSAMLCLLYFCPVRHPTPPNAPPAVFVACPLVCETISPAWPVVVVMSWPAVFTVCVTVFPSESTVLFATPPTVPRRPPWPLACWPPVRVLSRVLVRFPRRRPCWLEWSNEVWEKFASMWRA
jgi:hypothetical protein